MRIGVVVPARDEGRFIAGVLGGIPGWVDRIVVVDDLSGDETAENARACDAGGGRIAVLCNERNVGVGGSTVAGFRHLLDADPAPDILVKVDGDGQMPLEHLPALLDPIVEGRADYTKGNRLIAGESLASMPPERRFGNRLSGALMRLVSGHRGIGDPQNGFVAIRSDLLLRIRTDRLNPRWFFENDMLVRVGVAGGRVEDVAMPSRYGEERSAIRPVRLVLSFAWHMAGALLWRLWMRCFSRS